ncbi:MAG: STAS domain-containing protein [Proteobacteria bacterium]|nr:STAS domain-containing protein [Pseudomonadota bacterium]
MAKNNEVKLAEIVEKYEKEILEDWIKEQMSAVTKREDLISDVELRKQSENFLRLFAQALQKETVSIEMIQWDAARELLGNISRSRAVQGFSATETATFVFSLKQPLFNRIKSEMESNPQELLENIWELSILIDKLGLYTTEIFIKNREEVIRRQQMEMIELSTPVVKIWEGVLAIPLIGTLDSARTQVIMETLLQEIVNTGSSIAIIDITGVPTVDTLVAQHLLKTVAAARLMGAECIVSGIRPQIAQTMVHLGVAFGDVITKASLADAINLAMKKTGFIVTRPQA